MIDARKLATPKQLVADFLARSKAGRNDICLDFRESEATAQLARHVEVLAIGEGKDYESFAHDIRKPLDLRVRYGLCNGLLESLEEGEVQAALFNILKTAKFTYFYITLAGRLAKPFWWWAREFHKVGARILWSEQGNLGYKFWASAYTSIEDLQDFSTINVDVERIERNMLANMALGLKELEPHQDQNGETLLLMGGPTLGQFREEIYGKARAGTPVVTTNGAYNWALEHGIRPAAQILLDAREFNRRFVEPYASGCKYFICSQCDPAIAAGLPREAVYLWHAHGEVYGDILKRNFPGGYSWYPVGGGNSVGLRAFPLLMMLGYRRFEIYGFDSCVIQGKHHAYEQREDDGKRLMVVEYGGRKFKCYPWMVSQAVDFMLMTKHMIGQHCEMEIHGDGLIAHCVKTLAERQDGSDEIPVLQRSEAEASEWYIRSGHRPDADAAIQEHL